MTRAFFGFRMLNLSLVVVLAFCFVGQQSSAQIVQQAVGGVAIDANGVVNAPTEQDNLVLQKLRRTAVEQAPADLATWTDLRAVSLKQLEAKLAECAANDQPIPDEVKYLAGLQRVQYVFIYPERNDIVLAGPAEGWDTDALGNVVGATSRRPLHSHRT